jgi:hypothetical protein
MTPEQRIKHTILARAMADETITLNMEVSAINEDNVDELFDEHNEDYELQDYLSEFRSGEVETGLPCEWSRHYESKSVATKMADGTWLGWTYWYGGGKHGEPEAVPWMDAAYELECVEEEKLQIVRTFTKIAEQPA